MREGLGVCGLGICRGICRGREEIIDRVVGAEEVVDGVCPLLADAPLEEVLLEDATDTRGRPFEVCRETKLESGGFLEEEMDFSFLRHSYMRLSCIRKHNNVR